MNDGKTFTVADLIALSKNFLVIQMIVSIAIAGIFIAFGTNLIRIFRAKKVVGLVMQNAKIINLPNLNCSLVDWAKKKGVKFAITADYDNGRDGSWPLYSSFPCYKER